MQLELPAVHPDTFGQPFYPAGRFHPHSQATSYSGMAPARAATATVTPLQTNGRKKPSIPEVKAKLLEGKRGLIVGIANDSSIAWGCAKAFRAFGAEVAVTYLNEKAKKFVEPLAQELEAPILMPLDT